MRRLASCFVFALALAAGASAQFRDTKLNDLLNRREISWTEAAAAALLSEALGLDTAMLFESARPYGSVYTYGTGLYIANRCGRKVEDVHKLRRKGLGWGEVAKRLGMHPGTFNKLRKAGAFDQGGFWPWLTTSHFRYGANPWDEGRRQGFDPGDIFVSAVLGRGDMGRFRHECGEFKHRSRGKGKGKGKRDDD